MDTLSKFLTDNYNSKDYIARMQFDQDGKACTYCYHPEAFLAISNGEDCYMSVNTLQYVDHKIRRDQQHIRRLKFLYADLDTYHTQFNNDQILMNLEENYFNRIIPTPTYIISSGRGMYLLWRVDEHINALNRWLRVQEYLFDQLREFGADRCVVTDYARIFRIPGSINSKSGKNVEFIRNSGITYTLYEIMQEFMPDQEMPKKSKSAYNRRYIPFDQTNKLYLQRMRDLRVLLTQHRDKEDAYRENILFLYRYYHLCMYQSTTAALAAVLKLNAELEHPLDEMEVVRSTGSAERYYDQDGFRISNNTLISFLSLTEPEIADMPSIMTMQRLKERRSSENRRAYKRRVKEASKQLKKTAVFNRHMAEYKMLSSGKTPAEIINSLGISRATYYADLQVVKQLLQSIKKPSIEKLQMTWLQIVKLQDMDQEEVLLAYRKDKPPDDSVSRKDVIIS